MFNKLKITIVLILLSFLTSVSFADAVNFNHAWLTNDASLNGNSDSKQLTFSFWVKPSTTKQTTNTMYSDGRNNISIVHGGEDGRVRFSFMDTSMRNVLSATGVTQLITFNDWHHVVGSFDLTDTGKRHLFVDGIEDSPPFDNYVNVDMDFTRPNQVICATNNGGAGIFSGDIAEMYINFGEYIDLSVATNLQKFRTTTGKAADLGLDGSTPTGSAPDIFFSGDTADWHTNKGTGGGFTEHGALTTASTSPIPELPSLVSISPSSSLPAQSPTITLTGTNFIEGMTIAVSGTGVTVSDITINSTTSATAIFTIDVNTTTGVRTVSVTTSDGTSNTVDFTINEPAPVAAFTSDKTSGAAPLEVQFTDQSTGSVSSWVWDFGDNNTSSLQNPSNTYTASGVYTVAVTVTGSGGSTTETKSGFIIVSAAPVATTTSTTPTTVPSTTTTLSGATTTTISSTTTTTTALIGSTTTTTIFTGITPTPNTTPTPLTETTPSPVPTVTSTPEVSEEIKATFDAEPTLGVAPLEVQFTDESTGNINAWLWNFGDSSESEDQNPTHTYQEAGLFTVTLTVSGFTGQDTITERNLIDARAPEGVVANFEASPTVGNVPLTVSFTDKSLNNPTAWLWEFGDGGGISGDQNPIHTYQIAGIFTVSLTVNNSTSTDTVEKQNLVNVSQENLVAEFKAEPTVGLEPLTVKFTDLSEPIDSITSWLWEFGDGANSSSQNPQHDYDLEGFYTVKLTVGSNSGENDVNIKTNLVIVKSQGVPIAEFSATPTAGLVPISVKFRDLSEPDGNIASWIWDFGDGATSIEQSPTHIYRTEGIRTVKLTVSNSNGADTETKINLIGARDSSAPIAEFIATPTAGQVPFKVTFTDNSASESITSWLWDFGDGATSTEQNPTHIYTVAGTFNVKLVVSGSSGTGEETKTNLIRVVEAGQVVAELSANPVLGTQVPFTVQFLDNSVGDITLWEWDFGDGNTNVGQDQEPIHDYTEPGKYTVKLTVNAANSKDTIEKKDLVNVVEEDATPTPTPTPTETPQPEVGKVSELTVIPDALPRSKSSITVTVTVKDSNDNPLENVIITASENGRNASVIPKTAVTDANGSAVFDVQFVTFRKISSITFTADEVSTQVIQQ